ncbi:MAG: GAF domain-containing protein, partial [Candidatus Viridilinea halotolerans]
ALAVENVRLAERSARLLAKEQLLAALGRAVSGTLDLQQIVEHTVTRLHAAFGAGALALLDTTGELVVMAAAPSQAHLVGRRWACNAGMVGWVVAHGQPFLANDLAATPELLPPAPGWEAWIMAPLRSGGQVIGMILVGAAQAHAFTYTDVDLIEAIAAQVSGPITSARLYAQAQRLAAQVQRRADELAVLNRIARTTSALLDQAAIVAMATQQIQAGFGFPQVDLFLFDEESNELVLGASVGSYPTVALGYRQHINLGLMGRAARTRQLVYAAAVAAEAEYLALTEREATGAELVVPIVTGERLLGVLNIEAAEREAFDDADAKLLTTVADMLAGALENVRLYRRAQAAAVLEERNRLARELHDSVTQQLFSMTLTAQAARAQLERNPPRVAGQLERLQETATAALAEMRALIAQLRPPALRDQGLVAALQQHAQKLSQREGIVISLGVVGDERLAQGSEQPIFRIVQEALNNVCKHAAACNVQITLEFSSNVILVRVRDDGAGFAPEATPSSAGRQLGILGMRERAAELGGTLELCSTPGSGTEVVVRVPRRV